MFRCIFVWMYSWYAFIRWYISVHICVICHSLGWIEIIYSCPIKCVSVVFVTRQIECSAYDKFSVHVAMLVFKFAIKYGASDTAFNCLRSCHELMTLIKFSMPKLWKDEHKHFNHISQSYFLVHINVTFMHVVCTVHRWHFPGLHHILAIMVIMWSINWILILCHGRFHSTRIVHKSYPWEPWHIGGAVVKWDIQELSMNI